MIYADTSFLAALYFPESHSEAARRRMAARPRVWLTPLHCAEWEHLVARHVFQRLSTPDQARRVRRDFERDCQAEIWAVIAFPERALMACAELAQRFGGQLPMRTLDTLHLACALELGAVRFWTFDQRQARQAQAVGLSTTPDP